MPLLLAIISNRWAQLALVAAGAYFYGFFSVPRPDIPAIVRNAEAGRDAHWRDKLREEERKHEQKLADAIKARDETPAIPDTPAWADELCRKSATCRDKGRAK